MLPYSRSASVRLRSSQRYVIVAYREPNVANLYGQRSTLSGIGDGPSKVCRSQSSGHLDISSSFFTGVTINNAQVGFDLSIGDTSSTGNQGVGAEAIIDAVVTNTPIFVRSSIPSNGHLQGSIVLNNIKLTNVPIAVGVKNGATVVSSMPLIEP